MRNGSIRGKLYIAITTASLAFAVLAGVATAEPSEEERLKQCDRDMCGIVQKGPGDKPLNCDLGKTWKKDEILKALSKSRISWPFGDAQCAIKLEVDRAVLAPGLGAGKNKVKVPEQTVNCEVDNGGTRQPVVIKLSPEIVFKDGKATSVSLNVQSIESSAVIKTAVWTATKMESTFGFFQKDFLKGINDYMTDWCPKHYPKPS